MVRCASALVLAGDDGYARPRPGGSREEAA